MSLPNSHDPLCPIARETWCIWPGDNCTPCKLITRVRADERNNAAGFGRRIVTAIDAMRKDH